MTTGKRQEFILLSDVLGLSMLVIAQNHRKPAACTEATVFGPFHVDGAPEYPLGADIANGAQGEPCFVDATVHGVQGEPVPGATVDVWQSDEAGFYDVQYDGNDAHRARGILHSDAQGRVYFKKMCIRDSPSANPGSTCTRSRPSGVSWTERIRSVRESTRASRSAHSSKNIAPTSDSATLRVVRCRRVAWTRRSSCLIRLVMTEGVTPIWRAAAAKLWLSATRTNACRERNLSMSRSQYLDIANNSAMHSRVE